MSLKSQAKEIMLLKCDNVLIWFLFVEMVARLKTAPKELMPQA